MAYQTHDVLPSGRRHASVNWEYRVYFAAILLVIALPIAVLQWTAGLLHPHTPNAGVKQRALSEARIITTTIFSA